MKLYSVFLPTGVSPPRSLERAKFVKLGFSWLAFLVTPVWAVRHGLWLALVLWLAFVAGIGLLVAFAHIGAAAALLLYDLGALAFGLEADRFRQGRLSKAGFLMHGLALGGSEREAELVYFSHRGSVAPLPEPPAAPPREDGRAPPTSGLGPDADLLGLFPARECRS